MARAYVNRTIILIFISLAGIVRAITLLNTHLIDPDGVLFIDMAKQIGQGNFVKAVEFGHHPLYPCLVAGLNFIFGDFCTSAFITSVLMAIFAVIPLYLLVKNLFGIDVAVIALTFYAFLPRLVMVHADTMTESTFLFFLLWAIYFGYLAITRLWIPWFALTGVFCALAFLSRLEGVFIVAFFMLWCIFMIVLKIIKDFKKAPVLFLGLILFCVIFVGGIFPYILCLKKITGVWTISARPPMDTLEKFVGKELYVEEAKKPRPPHQTAIDLLVRFRKASGYVAIPFLLIGICATFAKPSLTLMYGLLFPIFYLAGICTAAFGMGDFSHRFFLQPMVLLMPFIGYGFLLVIQFISKRFFKDTRLAYMRAMAIGLAICAIAMLAQFIFKQRRLDRIALKSAAYTIGKMYTEFQPVPKVISSDKRVKHYGKIELVDFKWREYPEIIPNLWKIARENEVDYLIMCEEDIKRCKPLRDVLKNPWFQKYMVFPEKEKKGIWKVYVYRVYR